MSEQTTKEIRFTLPTDADYANHALFQALCIINGEKEGAGFAKLVAAALVQHHDKLFDEKGKFKWVDQPTLIRELARKGISTNAQTLYNYRARGDMDGLFGSDGGKGLLYNLKGCILFFNSIKNQPRRKAGATAKA